MGTYKNIYIGIYLEVSSKTITEDKTILVSPTTGKQVNTLYHPTSGEKAVERIVPTKRVIEANPYNVESESITGDDMVNLFFNPAYDGAGKGKRTFILNSKCKYNIRVSHEDSFNLSFKDIDTKSLIEEFKEEFKEEIKAIVDTFGEVGVDFGVCQYFH